MPHETEIIIRGARQPVRFGEPSHTEPHTHSKVQVWHCALTLIVLGFILGKLF